MASRRTDGQGYEQRQRNRGGREMATYSPSAEEGHHQFVEVATGGELDSDPLIHFSLV
jgi:hypothetical protein